MTNSKTSQAEPDTMKTHEELALLAKGMHAQLEAGLSKSWDALERHIPLALLLQQRDLSEKGLLTYDFTQLCDAYAGQRAVQWIQPYLDLHATLTALGHANAAGRYDFGCDAGVWVAADRTLPGTDDGIDIDEILGIPQGMRAEPVVRNRHAKAIVLKTQSRSFLVVINENEFGRHSLHMREFWPDIRETLANDGYLGFELKSAKGRNDLTVLDIVKLSSVAGEYGDDLPDVSYPRRPHLSTFLAGNLMGGDKEAGIGLRYGDSRDKGYLLSVKDAGDDMPEVSHSLRAFLGDIDYVANNFASVIDCLREDALDQPGSASAAPEALHP